MNGWEALREMFKILIHKGMQIQTTLRFHLKPIRVVKVKISREHMLARMRSKGNTPLLLMGVQTDTTTLEINLAAFQKTGNSSTSRNSHSTPGHIHKRCYKISQRHLLNCVHSSFIHNSQKLQTRYMSLNWRMDTENVVHLHNGILFSY